MYRSLKSCVIVLLSTAAISCGWVAPTSDSGEVIHAALSAYRPGLWPSPYILVCWEQRGFGAEKQLVREAVEDSWMRHSRLVFAGWDDCSAETVGIRITLENGADPDASAGSKYGWPRAQGDLIDGEESRDIRLTFDFRARAAELPECANGERADLEACIRSSAVHEFGHALGFVHEQARTDVPVQCGNRLGVDYAELQLRAADLWKLGPFDHDSVMAFCTPQRSATDMLSSNDIFYLQQAYGRKTAGGLAAFDGRCLDFAAGDASPSPAQTYECLGGTQFAPGDIAAPHQHVRFSASDGALTLAGSQRVLEVPGDDASEGKPLQLGDARASEGQKWSLPSVVLRGMGGMCVAPLTAAAAMSSELVLRKCDVQQPEPSLLFRVSGDGALVHTQSGLCLHATDMSAAARLQLAPCSGATSQRWTLAERGALQAFAGAQNLCVDIGLPNNDLERFFGSDDYNRLQLYDCNGQPNQVFSVAGPVVGQAGKCMEVAASTRRNGTQVRLATCNAQANQVWELSW